MIDGSVTAGELVVALVSGLVVGAWFLLPGLPWAIWWSRRERLRPVEAMALTAALGLAIGSVASLALLALGRLSPGAILLVVGSQWLVGLAVLLASEIHRARHALATGEPPSRRGFLPARRPLVVLGLTALVLVALASQAVSDIPGSMPRSSTSWYYALVSLRAGADGSLGVTLPEWGLERPFKADYLTFTAHFAAAELIDPTGLRALESYRVLILLVAALHLLAFLRRWSLVAGLLALGVFVSGNLWITKFDSLRPEAYGVAAVMGSLWAASHAWSLRLDDRPGPRVSLPWLGLAGVLGAITALGHLEMLVLGAVLGLALFLVADHPGWRLRLASAAAIGAIVIVGFGATLLFSGSDVPGGIQLRGSGGEADQSWLVFNALAEDGSGRPAPVLPNDPAYLAQTVRSPWLDVDVTGPPALIGVAIVLLAIIAVVGGPAEPRARRLLLFGCLVVAILGIVSLAIFLLFPDYIPRRIGLRRLLPYAAFGLSAIVAAGAATAFRGLALLRLDRRPVGGWLRLAAATICLVFAVGLIGTATVQSFRDRTDRIRDVLAGRDAYRWIAQNTPPDARILVNGYTDGVVAVVAERPGIVDGRAPYHEDALWVEQAIRDTRLARSFFAAPSDALLDALDPDYIVVGPGRALAMASPFRTDRGALDKFVRLQRVENFGPVRIYRVVSEA